MALYLTVHTRYNDVQWGLFDENRLLVSIADDSKQINKVFIERLDKALNKRTLSLGDLSFIAVHQGPAPFTTLRVCLSLVNGIGFATGLPLVGVNGLEALLDEYAHQDNITVAMLNAFGHDVYYAINDPATGIRSLGYASGEKLLNEIQNQFKEQEVTFLGNACPLYHDSIQSMFGIFAHTEQVEMASLERIASQALQKWKQNDTEKQIMPLYLKEHSTPLGKTINS
jgi:tRNA threonylcarbamoyladenosine biosynthesis protein TsaB